ncbi:asparagine synthase (glutamine-hydrolyzing) [Caldicellulosiruptor saccharolyticus DSM 8903]|uniref:asparagine synthase (glutamine-hydrolyzing) n=1 Tax=Caldicellulosiruptor saccharolyticus (strain ATCC 43494 / DSM 8903 / Tp8T 6331) TaxID=351627 RepID=A4XLL9_CALS8|nr:asparagine synthase (glutamine-hydrolyzing) [Caldicellulosiruptor saccharolyticus]ABP67804.1 asparagine synthase (glutamine-hydrolyzing) [Caldicellulosiruptor saccharolyticus DSM 8903]
MCGISGWVCYWKDISNCDDIIKNMADALLHRGPDEGGFYLSKNALLGHRRLTIIDPEGGKQPMVKEYNNQKYIVVYNGELYNTPELKKELQTQGYTFSSYSDTEVLLTSYIHWKEECVKRLNGIFAFAVYNETTKELFLARDHLGVKPLFFSLKNGNFLFASEIKALLRHPLISPVVGKEGVYELIGLCPARSPFCAIFKDIIELPPGHYVIYDPKGITIKEYWELKPQSIDKNVDEIKEMVRSLVIDAIERQLVSDFEICSFLSGGLDSTIITTVANRALKNQGKTLKTFSIDYEENKNYYTFNMFQPTLDTDFAKMASQEIGTDHIIVEIDNDQLSESLYQATVANDLPGMADIDSSLLLFTKEVRQHAKVALSGECADEIFGGYPWYWSSSYKDVKTFPWSPSLDFRSKLLSQKYSKDELKEYVNSKYQQSVAKVILPESDSEQERRHRILYYLNVKWFMLTLLNRKDRMSMTNSLEVRVPFADYRLVEFLYNIPWKVKYLENAEKGLLRCAFEGLIPEIVKSRKKSPYPKTYNPRYLKNVSEKVKKIIESLSPIFEIINKEQLKEILDNPNFTFEKPWFGQLMTLPQFFGYIVQLDFWAKVYNVNFE